MRIKISDKDLFVARVAGVFRHEDKILLHRAEQDDFWALPGGGCEFSEDMQSALVREMREELDGSVLIGPLAFSVENFFNWNGKKSHEIGFYFHAQFAEHSKKFYDMPQFFGMEKKMDGMAEFHLLFQWFPLQEINSMDIRPQFLKNRLQTDMTMPSHIVNRS